MPNSHPVKKINVDGIGDVYTQAPYIIVYKSTNIGQYVWLPCRNMKTLARHINALQNNNIPIRVYHATKSNELTESKIREIRHSYVMAITGNKNEDKQLFFDKN